MRSLLDDGSRSVIFLFDVAGCLVPPSIRNGRNIKFRKSVAREYTTLLMAAAERLLAHLDEGAKGDVLWSYRLFDSRSVRNARASVVRARSSLTAVTPTSVAECRKAVLTSMMSSAEEAGHPTASAEAVSTAINDGISAISPGGLGIGSPDSFLQDSTDTDATPTRKAKEERDKIDNAPLIVLFACVPQSQNEIALFLDGQSARGGKENVKDTRDKSLASLPTPDPPSTPKQRSFLLQLQHNLPLKHAIDNVSKSKIQLLWVHAYSRRAEETACFLPAIVSQFSNWVSRKPATNAFVDLHSLLMDRSIAPFSARCRRLSRPAQENYVALESQTDGMERDRQWTSLDMYMTPSFSDNKADAEGGNHAPVNLRVLRAEICGPFPKDRTPKQYVAFCSSLLRVPESGNSLAELGAFDCPASIARPMGDSCIKSSGIKNDDSTAQGSVQWVGAFSGLMISLSHSRAFLVARIYCFDDDVSSLREPFKTVLIQALTPLSAIIRCVDPSRLRKLQEDVLLTNHLSTISVTSSKRIFPDPCTQNWPFVDSVGEVGASLNARFFESHLSHTPSTSVVYDEEASNNLSAIFRKVGMSLSPQIVSAFLENLKETPAATLLDRVSSDLEDFEDDMNSTKHLTKYSSEELGTGKAIMEKLRVSLTQGRTPNVESALASHVEGSLSDGHLKTIDYNPNDNTDCKTPCRLRNTNTKPSSHEPQGSEQTQIHSVPCTPDPVEQPRSPTLHAASLLLSISRATPPRPLQPIDLSTALVNPPIDSRNSPPTFTSIAREIEDEILLLNSIDETDLLMQAKVVLGRLRCMVHLGNQTEFSFVREASFKKHIQKFSNIQKTLPAVEKARTAPPSSEQLDRNILIGCMRAYAQATLLAFKAVFSFDSYIKEINHIGPEFSEQTQRILERGLKRASKIVNLVQVLSVSQDRHINDCTPYSGIFDDFFIIVMSCFGANACNSAASAVAKALADEYEKLLEPSGQTPFASNADSNLVEQFIVPVSSRPDFSSVDISPMPSLALKRSRPRDRERLEGGAKKRARTKDLKRVLADAKAVRTQQSAPRRESARLTHEKEIQRPLLQKKSKISASFKRISSNRSSDLSFGCNLVPKKKDLFADMLIPESEHQDDDEYVLPLQFYPKELVGSRSNLPGPYVNEICVPATPEDEE